MSFLCAYFVILLIKGLHVLNQNEFYINNLCVEILAPNTISVNICSGLFHLFNLQFYLIANTIRQL